MDYTPILTDIYNILQQIYALHLFNIGVVSAGVVLFILYSFIKRFI